MKEKGKKPMSASPRSVEEKKGEAEMEPKGTKGRGSCLSRSAPKKGVKRKGRASGPKRKRGRKGGTVLSPLLG